MVSIASAASTAYDTWPDTTSRELFAEAAAEAFADTALDPPAVYIMGDLLEDQGHMGPLFADHVGCREAASVRVESACASGGAAVREAVHAIEAGAADVALAGGVEVMSIADIEHVTDGLANAADEVYENEQGLTFPGIYALMARRYLHEFDGRLTLTGQLRGASADEVAIGDDVAVGTERRDEGVRLVTFRPVA
jgi:acetyl-CoA acetyltransferase